MLNNVLANLSIYVVIKVYFFFLNLKEKKKERKNDEVLKCSSNNSIYYYFFFLFLITPLHLILSQINIFIQIYNLNKIIYIKQFFIIIIVIFLRQISH